jgi:hypothetical protein
MKSWNALAAHTEAFDALATALDVVVEKQGYEARREARLRGDGHPGRDAERPGGSADPARPTEEIDASRGRLRTWADLRSAGG